MTSEDGHAHEGVGRRVRALHKLAGLTQADLAAKMGVSLSLVKQVEQGRVPATPSFVAKAARALRTTVDDLYGQASEAQRSTVAELRRSLIEFDDIAELCDAVMLPNLEQELNAITSLYLQTEYSEVSARLPDLMRSLLGVADSLPAGHRREQAFGRLAEAYGKALATAYKLGHLDLAAIAAERCRWAAQQSNDPLLMTMADYHRALILLYSGAYDTGQRVIQRAYDRTEGLLEDAGLVKVRGSLHLRAAVLAARAGERDAANNSFGEASTCVRLLDDLPPDDPYSTSFDQDDVAIHSVAIPLELMDPTTAARRAAQVTLSDAVRPSRAGHHWIDTSRALLLHGDHERCFKGLTRAREIAPELTRNHPQVREMIITLAERRRRSDDLTGFARWIGIGL